MMGGVNAQCSHAIPLATSRASCIRLYKESSCLYRPSPSLLIIIMIIISLKMMYVGLSYCHTLIKDAQDPLLLQTPSQAPFPVETLSKSQRRMTYPNWLHFAICIKIFLISNNNLRTRTTKSNNIIIRP